MPIREKQFPVSFTPKGLTDALDSTEKFHGSCLQLADLIFDQLNPDLVVARPGIKVQADFAAAGFIAPGWISVHTTVGDITYGLIASGRNSGQDEPFAYNNATSAFVTVSGITNLNTPTTVSMVGAWTPPTMAVIGTLLIVTHPGFPGGATKIGWFDISNPAAPTWTAGDVSTNALPSVPTWVANFSNRAYYGCGQTTPYSDVLAGTARASSSQALTIGDTSATTAAFGLPVQTTSSGISQALIIFKATQCWQVTGDPVGNNLALNFLSLNIGTRAPRSVWQSPFGLYFICDGGPYVIDTFGAVRSLTHTAQEYEPDVQAPFQNAVTPSRVAGCYAASIYRICLETIVRGNDFVGDYWFDEHRRRWNGPHTFQYDCASEYMGDVILSSSSNPAFLFKSEVTPSTSSAYSDNGVSYTPTLQSSLLPKDASMSEKQVVESTLELANGGAITTYFVQALDDQQSVLDTVSITVANSGKLWGTNVWGDGSVWTSGTNRPRVYNVQWNQPLVFQKMAIYIQSSASSALAIGVFRARYQETGYTNALNPTTNTTNVALGAGVQIAIGVSS